MTRDPEIRALLVPALRWRRPDALLVQEWGIGYDLFADVAAIGAGLVEAWEIKSAADSLARLRRQVPLYSRLFDRCTLVTAPCHVRRALELLPAWWGVLVYDAGGLRTEREAQANDEARVEGVLWFSELLVITRTVGAWAAALAKRRADDMTMTEALVATRTEEEQRIALDWHRAHPPRRPHRQDMIAALATLPRELVAPLVREALRGRSDWRRPDGYRTERRG